MCRLRSGELWSHRADISRRRDLLASSRRGQDPLLAAAPFAANARFTASTSLGFKRADGSEIGAAMVMGIFEVEGNRIVAWRDYYDVRNAEKWATS